MNAVVGEVMVNENELVVVRKQNPEKTRCEGGKKSVDEDKERHY